MRLIDADVLRQDWLENGENEYVYDTNAFLDSLDNAPTIEERKKGRWISLDDFRGRYNEFGYKCSECDEHSDYEENFCPNCGADMR